MSIDKNNLPTAFLRAIHRAPALRLPEYPLPAEKAAREVYGHPKDRAERPMAAPEDGLEGVLSPKSTHDSRDVVLAEFFVPGIIPKGTAQQKGCTVKNGKPLFFTKTKVRNAEQQIKSMLFPHAPMEPFLGPLRVAVVFLYPKRKPDKSSLTIPHDVRPDVENVFKLVGDQMTNLGFWKDDAQISTLELRKVWSDTPGIRVTIERDVPV